MQFKERVPAPEPDPQAVERDDVQVVANRCPYCRDDVRADDAEAVVCAQCLTRHHDACWVEGGTCSSCGHDVRMRRDEQEQARAGDPVADARQKKNQLKVIFGILIITLGALFAVYAVAQDRAERRAQIMEQLREAEREKELRRARDEALRLQSAEAWLEMARREAEADRAEAEAARELYLQAEQAGNRAAAKAAADKRYWDELERTKAQSAARLREAEARKRIMEAQQRALAAEERAHALRKAELSLEEGERLEAAKDLAGAEASYSKAIRFAPKDARGYLKRARLREARGDTDGAVYDYERALLDPSISDEQQAEVDRKLEELDPIEDDE